jgi:diguanylate cyclase (GGDEF)-like protein
MLSFLVKINKLGAIEQVIWSDPEEFVSDDHNSIFQLFSKDDKNTLLKAMKKSAHFENAFFCDAILTLRDQPVNMLLCIMSMKKRYLVFAAEHQTAWNEECVQGYQAIILMFMSIIKSFVSKAVSVGGSQPANEQTEMIQTLVSELKSRKQLLEDANTKLNTTNQDLNNRLVQDSLTGLVSRYQYRAEIEYMIGKNPGKLGIFTFIDIDNFKSVNDRYGHGVGDQFLVEFSRRLKEIPVDDMVRMRISGDEFGLFVFGMEQCGAEEMEGLWHKVKTHVLSKPIEINGHRLPVTVSAGMSVYGRDTKEIYELIEYADHAMYSVKRNGKNHYRAFSA